MLFHYPMIIRKSSEGYWGEFPDVKGCNATGDTLKELLEEAKEALSLHLSCVLADGEVLNEPSNLFDIKVDSLSRVSVITAEVNLNKAKRSVKKTLTIPYWLNEQADSKRINFSQTLQEALIEKISK